MRLSHKMTGNLRFNPVIPVMNNMNLLHTHFVSLKPILILSNNLCLYLHLSQTSCHKSYSALNYFQLHLTWRRT